MNSGICSFVTVTCLAGNRHFCVLAIFLVLSLLTSDKYIVLVLFMSQNFASTSDPEEETSFPNLLKYILIIRRTKKLSKQLFMSIMRVWRNP